MQDRAHTVDDQIRALIERTVRDKMGSFGLNSVNVRAGEDHDGDPVIFVEAIYGLSETPVDLEVTSALATTLRSRLWEHGEVRFPHIRHKFNENQKVKLRRRANS